MTNLTPLRLDANLKWLFTELPFEQRFDAAAEAGFTAVEYASPYGYTAQELQQRISDAGLTQVLINTPATEPGTPGRAGFAALPDEVERFRSGVTEALEYATALDADFVHVLGGVCPEDVPRDRAFDTFVANIAWAAEQAAGTNITLLLEAQNHRDVPGFVLDSVEQAASVVQELDSAHLGLLFDVYHCQIDGGEALIRMRRLYPLIQHIQIADTPRRSEPGTGEISWGAIFDELRSQSYAGWIGCEYRPQAGTADGLGWRADYGLPQAATRKEPHV